MTTVIRVEGLGKEYRRMLGDPRAETLRDALTNFMRSPLAAMRPPKRELFWALRDVNLEVQEGEVLGLIGRNGAGKTTLLKILSRITRPTEGWAEIHGRVRSLLEVGTGFHGELSGRENTYLSGSILGMSKREVDRKFDEIVAFAEIEKFIDTPVKFYSSGMYVRLAFAVAAHLEPEILLVDEVLAVGDLNFQKKCMGKMGDVAKQGRTIVLVSHQMNQIRRLCDRVVWVDSGTLRMTDAAHQVVSAYESQAARSDRAARAESVARGTGCESANGDTAAIPNGTKARFMGWAIADARDESPHTVSSFGPVIVKFRLDVREAIRNGHHGIALRNHDQQLIWGWGMDGLKLEAGEHELRQAFPSLPLRPGAYSWLVSLYEDGELVDMWDCLPEMMVSTESWQHQMDEWNGVLNFPVEFEVRGTAKVAGREIA